MNPPTYQVQDLFACASQVHQAVIHATEYASVQRIVALYSMVLKQHASGTGNTLTTHDLVSKLLQRDRSSKPFSTSHR